MEIDSNPEVMDPFGTPGQTLTEAHVIQIPVRA